MNLNEETMLLVKLCCERAAECFPLTSIILLIGIKQSPTALQPCPLSIILITTKSECQEGGLVS